MPIGTTARPKRPWPVRLFASVLLLAGAGEKIDFNRQVRSILADKCFACHGPDTAKVKGKLRLDVRETAIGRGAIVPGKPEESELVSRISALASRNHGTTISIAVNATNGTHTSVSRRSSFWRAASGRSSTAASAVRAPTSVAGESSRTATRIIRYGTPQMTDIAANRIQPRRVISVLYQRRLGRRRSRRGA